MKKYILFLVLSIATVVAADSLKFRPVPQPDVDSYAGYFWTNDVTGWQKFGSVPATTNVITVPDFVPDGAVVEIHAEGPTGEQKPYIVRIYEDDGTIKNPFTPEKKIFHRAQNP